jgi:hypothetical protein
MLGSRSSRLRISYAPSPHTLLLSSSLASTHQDAVSQSGPSTYVLVMKALLTFLVIPAALWFNAHAFLDITLNGRWDLFGDTWIHVRRLPKPSAAR